MMDQLEGILQGNRHGVLDRLQERTRTNRRNGGTLVPVITSGEPKLRSRLCV
jgi:hypothetical protein